MLLNSSINTAINRVQNFWDVLKGSFIKKNYKLPPNFMFEDMNSLSSPHLSFTWYLAVRAVSCPWKNLFLYSTTILFDKAGHINGLSYCENYRLLTI
jgi:hypothetical protein